MASEQDVIESLGIQITSNASGATKSLNTLNKRLERLIDNLTAVHKNSNVKLDVVTTSTQKSSNAANKANNSFKSFGNTLSKTRSHSKSLAYAFGKFYANCFMLIRGVKKLGSAIESSMDYIETYNYFNVTMDKIGKEWSKDYKKWGYDNAEAYEKSFQDRIEALNTKLTGYSIGENGEATYTGEKNLGMNIEQMMNFQASVGAVTNSLGMMGETSVNAQKAMSMLATDLSSFKNIDISSVMTNLQSGLIGQSRSLYKYGIDITNATLQTYAYANGISKAVTEMTQGEKMQLRLLAILDQSRIAWGDQANTVNSVANQYRILKEQFGNLSRTIGSIFIPIVEKVLPIVNGLVIGMNKLLQTFGISVWGDSWLSDIMSGTSAGYSDDALSDLAEDSEDLADGLGTADKNAKKLKNNILGIDKLNIISTEDNSSSSSGSSSGSGSEIDLSNQIASAVSNYEKVWEEAFKNSENLAQKYANRIVNAFQSGDWKSVGQYWSKKLENTLKNIKWDKVYKKASGFGKGLANFLNGLIKPETFYQVGKTVASSLNTAIKTKLSFGQTFDWKNLGLSIANGINGFFQNYEFDTLAKTINVWVQGIWTTIKTAFIKIDWGALFNSIFDFVGGLDGSTVILLLVGSRFLKFGKNVLAMSRDVGKLGVAKSLMGSFISTVAKLGGKFITLTSEMGVFDTKLDKIHWALIRVGDKTKSVSKNLTEMQKGVGSVVTAFVEFKVIQKLVSGVYDGTTNLAGAILGVASAVTVAGVAFKMIFGLTTPVGIGISAIIGLFGVLTTVVEKEEEAEQKAFEKKIENLTKLNDHQQKVYDNIKATKDEYNKLGEEAEKQVESIEKQYEPLEIYKEKLDNIVDSNGYIKEGFEDQAHAIIEQLNPALDMNMEIINGQIQGYADLSKNIDDVIARKKAEAMVEAYQDEWVAAIKGVDEAYSNLNTQLTSYRQAQEKVNKIDTEIAKQKEKVADAENKLIEARRTGNQNYIIAAEEALGIEQKKLKRSEETRKELVDNVKKQETAYKEAADTYGKMEADIENYDKLLIASQKGTAEECNQTIDDMISHNNSELYAGAAVAKIAGEETFDNYAESYKNKANEHEEKLRKPINDLIDFMSNAPNTINPQAEAKKWTDKLEKIYDNVDTNELGKAFSKMLEKTMNVEISGKPKIKTDGIKIQDAYQNIKMGLSVDYKGYATGGFPEDGWFRATKGEYLGKFDDGTSYVATNKQIQNGIATGVEDAAYRGMLRAISQGNSQSSEQTIIVQSVLDGKVIAQSTNRYNARSGSKMLGYGTGY